MQVIDAAMVFKIDENGMPLEASLGIKLRHPNIVLLIDYATHVSTVAFHPRSTRCHLLQSLEAAEALLPNCTISGATTDNVLLLPNIEHKA